MSEKELIRTAKEFDQHIDKSFVIKSLGAVSLVIGSLCTLETNSTHIENITSLGVTTIGGIMLLFSKEISRK